jgi:hypothetical protein
MQKIKIKEISERRIQAILDKPQVELFEGGKTVLLIIPHSSLESNKIHYDLRKKLKAPILPMIRDATWTVSGPDISGYLSYTPRLGSYVRIYNNGILESVDSFHLKKDLDDCIPTKIYEQTIAKRLQDYLKAFQTWNIELPATIIISLEGITGLQVPVMNKKSDDNRIGVDKLTEYLLLDTYEVDVHQLLKPCFDGIWKSAGWLRSMNYDENGNWIGDDIR